MIAMDTQTLTLAVAMAGLSIVAVTALFVAFRHERSLAIFSLGFLSAMVGFVLLIGQNKPHDWASFILANALIVFYQLCMAWGVRSFFGVGKGWPARFWAYMAAWLALLTIGTYVYDSFAVRAIGASVFIIAASVEFLVAVRGVGEGIPPIIRRAAWGVVLAFIACHLVRIGLVAANANARLMDDAFVNAYTFSFTLIFSIAMAGLILIIDVSHLVSLLEKKNAKLESLAMCDGMTGLRNRHALELKLEGELERASRYRVPLSVILFDIDYFKRVNDTWGHQAGDGVIKRMAELTSALVRQPDDLFRWGGEEFMLVAPHTDRAGATALAEKLRAAIEAESFPEAGTVTASFGVAEWKPGEDCDEWFKRVDRALYRAKNTGRNRVVGIDAGEAAPAAMVRIDWKAEWSSGNRLIDGEHRELLGLSNNLIDLSLVGADATAMLEAFDALIGHIQKHFGDEERVLAELVYPGLAGHALLHAKLVSESLELRAKVEAGELDHGALFDFLVDKVVVEHLVREDSQFFEYTHRPSA